MGYAVGLMSGTSLDGIDVALVEIKGQKLTSELKLVDFMTVSFSEIERAKIMESLSVETSDVQKICSLNFSLGYKFADAVKQICAKNKLDLEKLDVIGSHGQTIYHQPKKQAQFVPSTLQIGEPAVIAYETNTKVVSNFRTMDMAAGGQGAPLVPYTEWILYGSQEKSRVLQNVGGIGNVTILPKQSTLSDITAFDTGPGNMIIDEICKRLFNTPYDKNGEFAAKGNINESLLTQCMEIPYINEAPPKSTGRELFGKEFVEKLIEENKHLSKYDLLATMTMFTAKSIASNYQRFIFPHHKIDEVIIGGGGSYNKTFIRMLQNLLKTQCKVLIQEDIGYSSEAKEAIAFALLANETINGNGSNVPNATGAKECVILGNITLPPIPTNEN